MAPSPTIAPSTRRTCSPASASDPGVAGLTVAGLAVAEPVGLVEHLLHRLVQSPGERVDLGPRDETRGAHLGDDRLTHDDRDAAETRDLGPVAAQYLLGSGDAHRHDRHTRLQRQVRGPRLEHLDLRAVLTGALRADEQDLPRLEHRDRLAQCLAVGAVSLHREPAQHREQPPEHRNVEQRLLAHVAQPPPSEPPGDRDVDHLRMGGRHQVATLSRQTLETADPRTEQELEAARDDPADHAVEHHYSASAACARFTMWVTTVSTT